MSKRKRNYSAKPQAQRLEKASSPLSDVEATRILPTFNPVTSNNTQPDNTNKYQVMFTAYKTNAWVNRAVNVIAASVVADGWKPIPLNPYAQLDENAEAVLLKFLSQPNDTDSLEDIIRMIVCDLLICGNSYIEVVRFNSHTIGKEASQPNLEKDATDLGEIVEDAFDMAIQRLDGVPRALYHVPADSIKIVTDKHGKVQKYTQAGIMGGNVDFQPSQIIHFALKGVNSEVYGESPLEPLERDLVLDLYRQVYLQSQLENGAKLGPLVSIEGAKPEELKRMQEYLYTLFQGMQNAGKPMVTNGKAKFSTPASTEYDGASQLGNDLKEKILTCLGVPVGKLGTVDAGSMGATPQEGANKTFIQNTVKPLARLIERQFNLNLIPDFQVVGVSGYGIAIMTEDVDILSTHAQTVINLVNAGIFTTNEARVALRQVPFANAGDLPIKMTSQGAVSLEDIEQHVGIVTPFHNGLSALSNLISPPAQDEAAKDLRRLTGEFKKALQDEQA